jgi:hypothetical protein
VIEEIRTASRSESRNSMQDKISEFTPLKTSKNYGDQSNSSRNSKNSENGHLLIERNITMALAMQKTS